MLHLKCLKGVPELSTKEEKYVLKEGNQINEQGKLFSWKNFVIQKLSRKISSRVEEGQAPHSGSTFLSVACRIID